MHIIHQKTILVIHMYCNHITKILLGYKGLNRIVVGLTILHEQQMPRYLLSHLYFSSERIAFFYILIRFRVCTANEQQQWEVLDRSKVNNFANQPLYLCRISVSDSSLVKVYQRIDRPPSLPFGCEQLVILNCPIKDSFYVFILYIVVTSRLKYHVTMLSC